MIKSFLARSPSAIFFRFSYLLLAGLALAASASYYLFDDMMMTFKGRKDTKKDIHEGVLS